MKSSLFAVLGFALLQTACSTPSHQDLSKNSSSTPSDAAIWARFSQQVDESQNRWNNQLMSRGMWLDPKTNLIWMRCSLGQTWNGNTCTGETSKYNWQAAQDAVAAMNRNGGFGGYTDWVVPHIQELASLISCDTGFKSTARIPAERGGTITIRERCREGYQGSVQNSVSGITLH